MRGLNNKIDEELKTINDDDLISALFDGLNTDNNPPVSSMSRKIELIALTNLYS